MQLGNIVFSVIFDRNGDRLFCGFGNGNIIVIDVNTATPIHTLKGHTRVVWTLAIDCNDTLFSGSNDRTIRSWNTTTHEQQWICQCDDRVSSVTTFNNMVFGGVYNSNAVCTNSSNGAILTKYTKSKSFVFGIVVYGLFRSVL